MIVPKKYNIHYFKDNNIRRWVAVAYIIYLVLHAGSFLKLAEKCSQN